jgi:hypothetical protein
MILPDAENVDAGGEKGDRENRIPIATGKSCEGSINSSKKSIGALGRASEKLSVRSDVYCVESSF